MSTRARPCCLHKGLYRCSIYLREAYCSVDCQKGDWKEHKAICKTLKNLSFQLLQPYHEVARVIKEIEKLHFAKKKGKERVLGHLISYALYQFGDRQ